MSELNLSNPATPAGAPSELAELKEQCAELRAQAQTLRIGLLLVALSVAAFFWLEVRRNSQALQSLRPQTAQVLEAAKVQDPVANRFIGQLVEYSKTHADFAAVLNKYGIRGTSAPAPATPVAAPATPPAAPKK